MIFFVYVSMIVVDFVVCLVNVFVVVFALAFVNIIIMSSLSIYKQQQKYCKI